jgi:hypothetical protein
MNKFRLRLYRDTPAVYQIHLQGIPYASLSEYLDMDITVIQAPNGEPETILTGQLVDQAALLGVLNNMYDIGFSLLSVECLKVINKKGACDEK